MLERWIPNRSAWVRCPMSPNILQVHTEYVLIKSVGPKILWVVAEENTGPGGWRICISLPSPYLNYGGRDIGGVALYRVEVQPVSGSHKI
ncbi:hypothetical protein TNCV_69081 [Trichonephila clavipes]|nr:hypothetical protein TNCV_69081 [Trichonephila clavipes]